MTTATGQPSLRTSWAYQWRVAATAVVLTVTWVLAALSRPWIDESATFDRFTDVFAWGAFLGGSLIRIWATLWIAGRKKRTIVTDGPYRLCRNPLYIGTFLMGLGLGLFLKSVVFTIGLALILALYVFSVVPVEEDYLRHRLADEYLQYCDQVPRWFPRLSRLRRDDFFNRAGDPKAVYRELVRMVWWMALPILAEVTCHLQGSSGWIHVIGIP